MDQHFERVPPRSNPKSKNGCENCKRRKVKCDERHPLCGNCARRYPDLLHCFDDFPPTTASMTGIVTGIDARVTPVSIQQLPTIVGGGLLDPFHAHPFTIVPSADMLLKHYLSVVVLRTFPFFHTSAMVELWWPFMRADAILFHIVLFLSARDLEAAGQRVAGTPSMLVKMEAVRLLNNAIQSDGQASDQMLVAAANFVVIEYEAGNVRTQRIHLEGLKRMVGIRGGMELIRSTNAIVASIIFWMTMASMNGPQFLPAEFRFALNEEEHHGTTQLSFVRHGIAGPLLNALSDANMLTKHFSDNWKSAASEDVLEMLHQLSSVLQRLVPPPKASNSTSDSALAECSRFAGALHVLFPLMANYPNPTLMVNAMVHKLKESLIYYMLSTESVDPVLLWCFAVGGVSAYQMPEKSWFIASLVLLCSELNIQSWSDMRRTLLGVMTQAVFCEESFEAVWNETVRNAEKLV